MRVPPPAFAHSRNARAKVRHASSAPPDARSAVALAPFPRRSCAAAPFLRVRYANSRKACAIMLLVASAATMFASYARDASNAFICSVTGSTLGNAT